MKIQFSVLFLSSLLSISLGQQCPGICPGGEVDDDGTESEYPTVGLRNCTTANNGVMQFPETDPTCGNGIEAIRGFGCKCVGEEVTPAPTPQQAGSGGFGTCVGICPGGEVEETGEEYEFPTIGMRTCTEANMGVMNMEATDDNCNNGIAAIKGFGCKCVGDDSSAAPSPAMVPAEGLKCPGICGTGEVLANPELVITIPTMGERTCAIANAGLMEFDLNEVSCTAGIPAVEGGGCMCEAAKTMGDGASAAPTPAPEPSTEAPTMEESEESEAPSKMLWTSIAAVVVAGFALV